MASLYNVFMMAFFVLACGAFLLSPVLAFPEANEQDFGLKSEPSSGSSRGTISPELHYFAKECLKKMSEECGEVIFTRIFLDEKNEISTGCCKKLTEMGENCHNAVTYSIITRPEFRGNGDLYVKRAAETYKMCTL